MIKPITTLVWIRLGKNVSVFHISRSFQGVYVIKFQENRVSKDQWKNVFKSQKRNAGSTLSQFRDIFQEENADQYQEKFVKKFQRKSLEWYKDIYQWIIVEKRNQKAFLTFYFEKKASFFSCINFKFEFILVIYEIASIHFSILSTSHKVVFSVKMLFVLYKHMYLLIMFPFLGYFSFVLIE